LHAFNIGFVDLLMNSRPLKTGNLRTNTWMSASDGPTRFPGLLRASKGLNIVISPDKVSQMRYFSESKVTISKLEN